MRQDYPILEFDPTHKAIIEPTEIIKPADIAPACVICFFQEVLDHLVEEGRLRKVTSSNSEIGEHPFYDLADRRPPSHRLPPRHRRAACRSAARRSHREGRAHVHRLWRRRGTQPRGGGGPPRRAKLGGAGRRHLLSLRPTGPGGLCLTRGRPDDRARPHTTRGTLRGRQDVDHRRVLP